MRSYASAPFLGIPTPRGRWILIKVLPLEELGFTANSGPVSAMLPDYLYDLHLDGASLWLKGDA